MDKYMSIATTILEQLGGSRFIAMTGANSFVNISNGLVFQIPRHNKINHVQIELRGNDLYKIMFSSVRKTGLYCRVIREVEDVGIEDLRRLFEEATGLRTSL